MLFTATTAVTNNTEVRHTNFKDHYPTLHGSMNWRRLMPFIRQATDDVICYLSPEFYAVLAADYTAGGTDPMRLSIREKIQDAIAYKAIYEGAPQLNINISDTGLQQTSSENSTSQPVNQWRFKSGRWDCLIKYYTKLDQALALMEKHIDDPFLATFKSSTEYIENSTAWFRTTAILSRFQNIQKSRRTFIALLPHLRRAEQDLESILCGPAYKELLTKIDGAENTDEEKLYAELVTLARHYLNNRALISAIPRLRVLVESDGIKVVSQTDSFDSKNPANREQIERLLMAATEDTEMYRNKLLSFLAANLETFTTYAENGYVESSSARVISSPGAVGGVGVF